MNERLVEFGAEFEKAILECEHYCFMTRAKDLQVSARDRARRLREQARGLRNDMILQRDEESANAALSYEEMAHTIESELEMWLAFKVDDPGRAWDCLVRAEGAARSAMQAHSVANGLEGYVTRLLALEKLLFPRLMFFSTGMIVESSKCSICGVEYGDCDHVKGRPYMGQICCRIVDGIKELSEVSIVSEPASKACRVMQLSDENGVIRDVLTWLPVVERRGRNDMNA